jgi:hypothetical protein
VVYLKRLAVIVIAYLASCAVAGLLLSLVWATQENDSTGAIYRIFARAVAFGALTASASLLVTPVIAYAEYAKERRFSFYAICGILAVLLPLLISAPADLALTGGGLALLVVFIAIGFVAATVYWLIAGRGAGIPAAAATD